ncbi:hypothetical protein GLOIN_2v1480631 [Rhizophagus irregularis DAOM 181602=DAOM 197198]|nr:hypothetical protein GLOIN_2v1480631 [Rhizophagus irregularis DAOM 181602=DAOM 197198]
MSTAEPTQKTRKAKTNKFILILEQFLERYNLSAESSPEQLSEHAPELNALLPDWKARKCVKEALARGTEKRSAFSKEQKEALVPDQRNNIFNLGPKGNKDGVIDDKEMVASSSNQSRFRKHLAEYGADPELIDRYAKDSKTTTASNKIQQERTEKRLANPGAKHASMVHAGPNPTPQHLDNLSEIALRHKINRLDAGKNYALGDPKSKKEPISDSENTPSLVPQLKNDDYNPFKGQIAEIDSMLVGF